VLHSVAGPRQCALCARHRVPAARKSAVRPNKRILTPRHLATPPRQLVAARSRPVIGSAQTISVTRILVWGTAQSIQIARHLDNAASQESIGAAKPISTTGQLSFSTCRPMRRPNHQARHAVGPNNFLLRVPTHTSFEGGQSNDASLAGPRGFFRAPPIPIRRDQPRPIRELSVLRPTAGPRPVSRAPTSISKKASKVMNAILAVSPDGLVGRATCMDLLHAAFN